MNRIPILFLLFLSILFSGFTDEARAETNQFVSIVNPVRISGYTEDIIQNLNAQYGVVSGLDLPATWLITYDVLFDSGAVETIKNFNQVQEIGIFMEVTRGFAEGSGIEYNDTGFWHHASSVFLSGYLQEDRVRLIDTVFDTFHEKFGYYPTSVGAWWIDSFSLSYMKERYGVNASLGVADQFYMDGYQVWGQYFSTPFYPSKFHVGIPASLDSNKLDVVVTQWAPRDPLNGYYSSLYSTQDYRVSPVNQGRQYFENIVRVYSEKSSNEFGHVTVGLEGDLNPDSYLGTYKGDLESVKRLSEANGYSVVTMEDFSNWYRSRFPSLSPAHIISSEDLLGSNKKVFWYQSVNYRVGMVIDGNSKSVKIFDFRTYHPDFQEPYFVSRNKQFNLTINIPSVLDELNNPEDVWEFHAGELKYEDVSDGVLTLKFDSGEIIFSREKMSFLFSGASLHENFEKRGTIDVKRNAEGYDIFPQNEWLVGTGGYVFRDITDIAARELARKRSLFLISGFFVFFIFLSAAIIRSGLAQRKKLAALTLVIALPAITLGLWFKVNSMFYYVSQAEIDALDYLSTKPLGRVVVVDAECLGCGWSTPEKPAVFSNRRSYVARWSRHQVVYNSTIFSAQDQKTAKEEFDKLNADYVYLVTYDDYSEKMPYSPGDLGVEKTYTNANAEVWVVNK